MLIWRSLAEVPRDWGRSAVAIGVFDGVHAGHRAIISQAEQAATAIGARTVVISFDPHPNVVVHPDRAPLMLTSVDHRAALLASLDVDALLVLPFTRELSELSPEEFVETVLVERLHAAVVVVGANFRFGHKAAGDTDLLRREGARHDFTVQAVELLGGDEPVSSVDPSRATSLVALLRDLSREAGKTLLMNLHGVELALGFFPRVVGIREGRVSFDLPPDKVTARHLAGLYEGAALDETAVVPADGVSLTSRLCRPLPGLR